jgi:TRAP-type C4-dicarboxylate transport system permease small subunit
MQSASSGNAGASLAPESAFDRVVGRISWLCGMLAGVAIVAIMILVCAETFMRPFRLSLLVTDEIAGYLNAGAVFLGLAWTLREGGFIRVEILYDRASGALKQAIRWLIVLSSFVFTAVLLWVCARHVIHAFNRDTRAVSVIETPEWIPQSLMVIGLAILLLQLLAYIVSRVRNIP